MNIKELFTDNDFEKMSWHDNFIYSISFPNESQILTLDIDYIFDWVLDEKTNLYKFWVSPCKLMFMNVLKLKIDIDFDNSIGIDIQEVNRFEPNLCPNGKDTEWTYLIVTDKGNIQFRSTGYIQKIEKEPILSNSQVLIRDSF